ncbi:hypothetical protein KJ910_02605 [Patescibacteria group bacterium]|nr:hypothetical protein [Patescibacteria group bacterium]MBU1906906.1 hypothetical protein [Patescibacteria group bacterium]
MRDLSQIFIRCDAETIDFFKKIAKDRGCSYGELFKVLLDHSDEGRKKWIDFGSVSLSPELAKSARLVAAGSGMREEDIIGGAFKLFLADYLQKISDKLFVEARATLPK